MHRRQIGPEIGPVPNDQGVPGRGEDAAPLPEVRHQRCGVLQVVAIESAIGSSDNGDAKFGGMNVSDAKKLRVL
jgi:hypothetical protein